MATMRAVQVAAPNGPFSLVERPAPDPGPGEVRIRGLWHLPQRHVCQDGQLRFAAVASGWPISLQ
jgi:hypothetical protein